MGFAAAAADDDDVADDVMYSFDCAVLVGFVVGVKAFTFCFATKNKDDILAVDNNNIKNDFIMTKSQNN